MRAAPGTRTPSFLSIRSQVVQFVHTPLGFFVLALLIVETFLFGAGRAFGLSEGWKIGALGIGIGLFLVVFGTVVWLVVVHPRNLVFGEESHVRFAALRMFGTESQVITGRQLEALQPEEAPTPPVGQLPAPSENN